MKNEEKIALLDKEFNMLIKNDIRDIILEGMQAGISIFSDDMIIQQVPIISQIVKLYKIGNTIRDRTIINRLFIFVFCYSDLSPKEKNRIVNNIKKNKRSFGMYVDYLLIILDRLNDTENTKLVGKVFLEFINEGINDLELRQYCFVINMLMPGDLKILLEGQQKINNLEDINEAYLRFISMGLMVETQDNYYNECEYSNGEKKIEATLNPDEHFVKYTKFGKKFISIISSNET